MIYDTLDEALTAVDESGKYSIQELLNVYDISVQYKHLTDNVIGFAFPTTRTIFAEQDLVDRPIFERVLSHEFIHCLLDDDSNPLLENSFVYNTKAESTADVGGFYIMLRNFSSEYDTPPESISIEGFMDAYEIKSEYYYRVKKALQKLI